MKGLLVATALLLVQDQADFDGAVRAYREARFADAHAAFARLRADAGDRAAPELSWNDALAALQAGDFRAAETAAEQAALRGGVRFAKLRDFLLGNTAFARCELAAKQATGPEAEPFAFDVAIAYAETARRQWEQCALDGIEGAAARRNVERAVAKADVLRAAKQAMIDKRKHDAQPQQKEIEADPQKPPELEPKADEAATGVEPKLAPETIQALLDRLQQKEKEKVELRRAQHGARNATLERDW
ncbi:MAG: hypothetical protein U1F36_00745 [Planctomycetota bacterium]